MATQDGVGFRFDPAADGGSCTPPDTCGVGGPNQCGCTPKACADLGAECGTVLDGCGGVLSCGTDCSEHGHGHNASVCIGSGPTQCSEEAHGCAARTCADLAAACGLASDGCGHVIDCGPCTPPTSCGGSGIPNHCGCTPKTCDGLGADCGTLPDDGCGAPLDCGPCPDGEGCDTATHRCVAPG